MRNSTFRHLAVLPNLLSLLRVNPALHERTTWASIPFPPFLRCLGSISEIVRLVDLSHYWIPFQIHKISNLFSALKYNCHTLIYILLASPTNKIVTSFQEMSLRQKQKQKKTLVLWGLLLLFGSKQQKCILSYPGGQKSKSKASTRSQSLWGHQGRILSCLL